MKAKQQTSPTAAIITIVIFLLIGGCFYKMCNNTSSPVIPFSKMNTAQKTQFINDWCNDDFSDSRSNIQGQILRQEKARLQYPETYKFIDHTFRILSADSGSVMITEKFTGSNGFGVPVGFFAFAFCTISDDSATLYQFICKPENEVTN